MNNIKQRCADFVSARSRTLAPELERIDEMSALEAVRYVGEGAALITARLGLITWNWAEAMTLKMKEEYNAARAER